MKRNRWLIIVGIVFVLCCACGSILLIAGLITPTGGTPTATLVDASIQIAQTAQMASTQTEMAISPTVVITSTNLPTLTPPVLPTLQVIPTSPNTPIPTNTFVLILPTNPPPAGAPCPCSGDTLNCGDFASQSSAQACMDYCNSIGAGDIHNLDGNANGLACENN